MRRFIIEKDFIVNGYRCVIVGNNLGYRCGYIEIPEDHSLHGKHYSVIDDIIDIHGGWTYSNFTINNYPTKASLIAEIADFLQKNSENAIENCEITNKERQIAFKIGENSFELTLVQKRKPKK